MKATKTGGRPMLDDTQIRGCQLNLRLRLEEYYTLQTAAQRANMSVSEYARQAITKGKIEPRISPETMGLIRRLCGMDNNLNQIARQANAAGYREVNRECLRLAEQIGSVIDELQRWASKMRENILKYRYIKMKGEATLKQIANIEDIFEYNRNGAEVEVV